MFYVDRIWIENVRFTPISQGPSIKYTEMKATRGAYSYTLVQNDGINHQIQNPPLKTLKTSEQKKLIQKNKRKKKGTLSI